MNRELIIICMCVVFVGLFFLQSNGNSTANSLKENKQPVSLQDTVSDTTNTEQQNSKNR